MEQFARLLLLLVAAALLWNLSRGTLRPWLEAKFLGRGGAGLAPSRASGSSSRGTRV